MIQSQGNYSPGEISLVDIIKVIIKRKVLFGITLVIALAISASIFIVFDIGSTVSSTGGHKYMLVWEVPVYPEINEYGGIELKQVLDSKEIMPYLNYVLARKVARQYSRDNRGITNPSVKISATGNIITVEGMSNNSNEHALAIAQLFLSEVINYYNIAITKLKKADQIASLTYGIDSVNNQAADMLKSNINIRNELLMTSEEYLSAYVFTNTPSFNGGQYVILFILVSLILSLFAAILLIFIIEFITKLRAQL